MQDYTPNSYRPKTIGGDCLWQRVGDWPGRAPFPSQGEGWGKSQSLSFSSSAAKTFSGSSGFLIPRHSG